MRANSELIVLGLFNQFVFIFSPLSFCITLTISRYIFSIYVVGVYFPLICNDMCNWKNRMCVVVCMVCRRTYVGTDCRDYKNIIAVHLKCLWRSPPTTDQFIDNFSIDIFSQCFSRGQQWGKKQSAIQQLKYYKIMLIAYISLCHLTVNCRHCFCTSCCGCCSLLCVFRSTLNSSLTIL